MSKYHESHLHGDFVKELLLRCLSKKDAEQTKGQVKRACVNALSLGAEEGRDIAISQWGTRIRYPWISNGETITKPARCTV